MPVIWVLLSLSSLGVTACRAREIPVYREYTRAIRFDGPPNAARTGAAAGPDRLALQSLKNSKAQEPYLGRETVLDMGIESGDSVFNVKESRPFLPAQGPGVGGETRRRKSSSSGKNWLAQSIRLPSLGQASTNAAASTLLEGGGDSSWGWLADEVTGHAEEKVPLPEEMLTEEDFNPVLTEEPALADIGRAKSPIASADRARPDAAGSAGGGPAADFPGQKPSEQTAGREAESFRGWTGGDSLAGKGYSAPSAVSELKQTRAMLSEWSVDSLPDFSAAVSGGGRDLQTGAGSSAEGGWSRRPDAGARGWGRAPSFASSPPGRSPASDTPSWKGSWDSRQPDAGLPSRFGVPSDPTPSVPAFSREPVRPKESSGGYKPAWQ